MKTRLQAEALESRECPVMIPVATGADFTLSISSSGRFASMQMAAPDWALWQEPDPAVIAPLARAMSQRILRYFPDQYDQIWFVNNIPELSPQSKYFGANFGVRNSIGGTGRALFDRGALFGSRAGGELDNFIHIASERDFYQRTGLHEFVHLSNAFVPELQSVDGGHWGFSSVGGQLGGWAPGTLKELVPYYARANGKGLFDADGPNGRDYFLTNSPDFVEDGDVPYSQLELYMLGLIEPNEVDPLQYGINPDWFPNGAPNQFGIFEATSINTVTIQNIVAANGVRTPRPDVSQRNFRGLVVYGTPNPIDAAQEAKLIDDVTKFSTPGSDGDPVRVNFWEATGGRARFTMEGLDRYIPNRDPFLAISSSSSSVTALTVDANGNYDTANPLRPILSDFFAPGVEIRVVMADVNGDKRPDFVVTTGPGVPARMAVISGDLTRYLINPVPAFSGSEDFSGGAFASAGDFDGDGYDDIAVSPDQGGGPRVTIFSTKGSTSTYILADFFGINDPNFRGGARTAIGDVNGDGAPDLVVAAGFGGGPRVSIYDGANFFPSRPKLISDFFAFPGADASRLRNGVYLSVGDLNADGFGDLVFGGGPGGAPRVFALSGSTLLTAGPAVAQSAPLANFFVNNDQNDRSGVRVATKNADGDFRKEIVVGRGTGDRVRVYRGSALIPNGEPKIFQDIDPFVDQITNPTSGVYVG